MELLTLKITSPLVQEELQEGRRRADAQVKRGMLAQMSGGDGAAKHRSIPGGGPLVTLKELAAELRMDRSAARRYILRLGVKPQRARTAESGYQVALVLTREQADLIVARRRAEGYC